MSDTQCNYALGRWRRASRGDVEAASRAEGLLPRMKKLLRSCWDNRKTDVAWKSDVLTTRWRWWRAFTLLQLRNCRERFGYGHVNDDRLPNCVTLGFLVSFQADRSMIAIVLFFSFPLSFPFSFLFFPFPFFFFFLLLFIITLDHVRSAHNGGAQRDKRPVGFYPTSGTDWEHHGASSKKVRSPVHRHRRHQKFLCLILPSVVACSFVLETLISDEFHSGRAASSACSRKREATTEESLCFLPLGRAIAVQRLCPKRIVNAHALSD